MDPGGADDYVEGLNDALLGNVTMAGFLDEASALSRGLFPAGSEFAIALERPDAKVVTGGTSPLAVRVARSLRRPRWLAPPPEPAAGPAGHVPQAVVASGTVGPAASVLAKALSLGAGAEATVVLVLPRGAPGTVARCADELDDVGTAIGRALMIACRLTTGVEVLADFHRALEGSSALRVAAGVLIARRHCTPREAFSILRSASDGRSAGLQELAEGIVKEASGSGSGGRGRH